MENLNFRVKDPCCRGISYISLNPFYLDINHLIGLVLFSYIYCKRLLFFSKYYHGYKDKFGNLHL